MNYRIKTIDNFLEEDLENLNGLNFNPIVNNECFILSMLDR